MIAALALGIWLSLAAGGGQTVVVPEPIPAPQPIPYFSLEAPEDVVEGYWDRELDAYRLPLDSIPARTHLRFSEEVSVSYGAELRSRFGGRRGRKHKGVDIPLPTGTNVTAAFGGTVRLSAYHNGYGNVVIIRHPSGIETCYAHLHKRLVSRGDVVVAGDIIATSGSTGRSTGPHLHFETNYCGRHFDPDFLIDFSTGTLRASEFILRREMLIK